MIKRILQRINWGYALAIAMLAANMVLQLMLYGDCRERQKAIETQQDFAKSQYMQLHRKLGSLAHTGN